MGRLYGLAMTDQSFKDLMWILDYIIRYRRVGQKVYINWVNKTLTVVKAK